MANAFDDLTPETTSAQQVKKANAFDDLDAPPATVQAASGNHFFPTSLKDALEGLKYNAGLQARAFTEGAASLPNMAMDTAQILKGYVEHPSMLLHPTQPITGELQSSRFSHALDEAYPRPQGFLEHAASLPAAIAGGAAVPIPIAASDVPANFVGKNSMKAQRLAAVLQRTQNAGLVVPPSTTNPSLINKIVETTAGKEATQNAARIINQNARNALAAKDIGLDPELMTPEAVSAVKEEAGKAFENARQIQKVKTDNGYIDDLAEVLKESHGANASFPGSVSPDVEKIVNTYLQPEFTGDAAVSALKQLRGKASDAFRQGNSELGRAYRGVSQAIESQLERGAGKAGPQYAGLVDALRNARKTYAQASTIEDAMDPLGNVSGTKLAAMWRRGDKLSGGLEMAAEHAASFPKANLPANSSNIHHFNTVGTIGSAALGEHFMGPWGMAAGVAWPMARGASVRYLLGPGQAGAIPSVITGRSASRALAEALAKRPGAVAAAANQSSD